MLRPWTLTAWGLISLAVALAGPFGTYQSLALPERVVYWAGMTGFAIVVGSLLRVLLRRWLSGHGAWTVALAVAGALSVLLVEPLRQLTLWMIGDATGVAPQRSEIMAIIFTASIGTTAMRRVLEPPPPVRDPAPRLLERLEPGRRGRVIRLAVSDHYVEVVTDRGAQRLLMRFRDAIAELDGIEGLRVHRSHWVALSEIRGREADKGRLLLVLSDGARVPVSRQYRGAVAARGLA
ncbi:LytTR family DNA-binding domain-containing protein [Actibacterium sp. MT2.3-13A]|uniref:LytTR family DNA-binding domain-containing protein n=1 Tax=Actibacterium sp. MT2.3-13A TaxID=2828332 RepID=UPI001BAC8D81|nr:LytTR family DNA-binding domain-containing protein [Actibacterium sp. MT2.3-13A]